MLLPTIQKMSTFDKQVLSCFSKEMMHVYSEVVMDTCIYFLPDEIKPSKQFPLNMQRGDFGN
jgi:hypothetical protein